MISATVTTADGAGDTSSAARIVMASGGNLCSDAGAGVERKGEHYITIQLSDVTGASRTAPTAAGTYTIYPDTGSEPAKSASFTIVGLDQSCQAIDADSASAHSGTVTLTSASGGVFAGSFDVTLDTGGHLTGSFSPSSCPQLAAASTNADPHTCN